MHGLCALVHELVGTVSMCMNYIAVVLDHIMHASQASQLASSALASVRHRALVT